MALSRFFGLLIAILNRSLFNVFCIRLDLDSSNGIKIWLDLSSGILSHALSCLFDSFVGDFQQVFVQCVKSAVRLYFAVFVCLSFSWGQHYSVLALNIVDSPILVFIPIVSGQFEQALPNLSSFNQSTVSSSLRKLVKPKKSERHSRSFIWTIISKPSCVLDVFICAK